HDPDPVGDMAFDQPDQENTFTELVRSFGDLHPGAAVIGLLSVALLVLWDRSKRLKKSPVPAPLVVVLLGVGLGLLFRSLGGPWLIESSHLVQVPVPETLAGFLGFLQSPNFAQWRNPAVYTAALTLAAVASLETLLNLEAVDKLDPRQRTSPPSRELLAQGAGNVVCGLVGGLPGTSGIVRSSGNINAARAAEVGGGVPREPAPGQLRAPAGLAQPDPAVVPGRRPARHGDQAGQPGAGPADVGGGQVPVRPVHRDGGGDRPDRPARRSADRA